MGILKDLAVRIQRTKYRGNADLLAQEIAAGLLDDGPIVVDSPLVLDQKSPAPPLTFRMIPVTDVGDTFPPPITFTIKGGQPFTIPSFTGGDLAISISGEDPALPNYAGDTFILDVGGSSFNFPGIDFKPTDLPPLPDFSLSINRKQGDASAVSTGGGGVGFYGVVQSGSGSTYSITYTKADGTTATDDFTMPTMSSLAALDAGTEVVCFVYAAGNRFLTAVWL